MRLLYRTWTVERHFEEERQARDDGIEGHAGDALRNHMQLIAPEILGFGGVRGTAEEAHEVHSGPWRSFSASSMNAYAASCPQACVAAVG